MTFPADSLSYVAYLGRHKSALEPQHGQEKGKSTGSSTDGKPAHGAKSAAVREYLKANKGAKPKEIVEAMKAKGISVSPNMVSVIKAKAGIKKAKRNAQAAVASNDKTAAAQTSKSDGLEAVLLLYKAARGQDVPQKQVTGAFLSLVEMMS